MKYKQRNVKYISLHCFDRSMLLRFTNTRHAECLESCLMKKRPLHPETTNSSGATFKERVVYH